MRPFSISIAQAALGLRAASISAAARVDEATPVAHRHGAVARAHVRRRPLERGANELVAGVRSTERKARGRRLGDHPDLLAERSAAEVDPRRAGMQREPRPCHLADRDAVRVVEDPAVRGHAQPIGLAAEGLRHRGEVRIGLGGDRRAHRRPGLDRALDDRRVLRLQLLEPLRVDADEQAPPVGRVRLATHEAGPLETIEDAGHRATREAAQLGQAGRGHLGLAGRELQAAQVGRVDAEAGGDDLVRPDRLGDQPAQAIRGRSRVDIVIGLGSSCRYLST